MKWFLMIAAAALMSVPVTEAAAQKTTARISGKCAPVPATITVPAGKTATSFKVVSLTNGTKCTVGGTPDAKGWSIKAANRTVYSWSKFKNNAPSERGGPLKALKLKPGKYKVYVDGGANAAVTIQWRM